MKTAGSAKWSSFIIAVAESICCVGALWYCAIFYRASVALGRVITPMIDDPKNFVINDRFCLWLMDQQWVFRPLETYLFFLVLMTVAITVRIWPVVAKRIPYRQFAFWWQAALALTLIFIGGRVMFWLED